MKKNDLKNKLYKLPYGDAAYNIAFGLKRKCMCVRRGGDKGAIVMNPKVRSAVYYYNVWLNHLVRCYESGMKEIPSVVAELEPEQLIGCGLAAMLCGVEQYYVLD